VTDVWRVARQTNVLWSFENDLMFCKVLRMTDVLFIGVLRMTDVCRVLRMTDVCKVLRMTDVL
jgi:hypothetical protein